MAKTAGTVEEHVSRLAAEDDEETAEDERVACRSG